MSPEPKAVAEAFWSLINQAASDWSFETIYEPAGE